MSKLYFFMGDTPTPTPSLNKREAWMPKGDLPYFDKVANRTFTSRREKRAWLAANGMREAGELIKASTPHHGREKVVRKPNPHAQAIREYVQSRGGTAGLLAQVQGGRSCQ